MTKTSGASYGFAGFTIFASLTLNDWAIIIGMVIAVATFGLNWWYRHQHLKIARGDG
jgi:hypothetical protein